MNSFVGNICSLRMGSALINVRFIPFIVSVSTDSEDNTFLTRFTDSFASKSQESRFRRYQRIHLSFCFMSDDESTFRSACCGSYVVISRIPLKTHTMFHALQLHIESIFDKLIVRNNTSLSILICFRADLMAGVPRKCGLCNTNSF